MVVVVVVVGKFGLMVAMAAVDVVFVILVMVILYACEVLVDVVVPRMDRERVSSISW